MAVVASRRHINSDPFNDASCPIQEGGHCFKFPVVVQYCVDASCPFQEGGRFAAEKPEKVQNVLIFWSPESTEKREKKTRRNFLYLRVRQERSAQIALICIQNKASLKIDFARGGGAELGISYMDYI